MGEAYIHFGIGTILFGLIMWLDLKREGPPNGVWAIAMVGVFLAGAMTYVAWGDHQRCLEDPIYKNAHPDDC